LAALGGATQAAAENVATQATVVDGGGIVYGSLSDVVQIMPDGLRTASIWVPSQNLTISASDKVMALVSAVMAQPSGSPPMASSTPKTGASTSEMVRTADGQLVLTMNYN